ncbi:MAG: FecR domain-containing protein [Bacteroidales bacterium]|nr:FecR domain-containing protein [Bacteroidales bacterium]MDD2426096.1 FecR domain-containing protein [Bacteroidales bacterium]MDD3990346.1 FecR domain-containing protein [Bacteroidales bacterium]
MKPLESAFEIAKIIARYQQGIITPPEKTILEEWLNESAENREFFERICNKGRIENGVARYSRIDTEKEYQQFIRKYRSRNSLSNYRRLLKYAALLILPLAIAATLLFTNFKREIPLIPPGFSRATLILADGRSIELKQDSAYVINESEGSLLTNANGLITYSKTEESARAKKNLYNRIFVPRNGEYQLLLEDGTKVWINSETEIEYPVSFNEKVRSVRLRGEAYFEVARNPDKPFIVELDDAKIEVLGTSFNVRAYKDDISLTTTLVEGEVSFSSGTGNGNLLLAPGEQFELDKATGTVTKRSVDVSLYTAWKDGRFAFRNQRLEDIFNTLSRWYNVQVVYQSEDIKEKRFTGDLKRYDDFSKILEIMGSSDLIKFDFRDDKVFVK